MVNPANRAGRVQQVIHLPFARFAVTGEEQRLVAAALHLAIQEYDLNGRTADIEPGNDTYYAHGIT
jgi:hypothetical protein